MASEQLGGSAELHIVVGDAVVLTATFDWLTPDVVAVGVGVHDLGQLDAYVFHLERTVDALRKGKFGALPHDASDAPDGEEEDAGSQFPF